MPAQKFRIKNIFPFPEKPGTETLNSDTLSEKRVHEKLQYKSNQFA